MLFWNKCIRVCLFFCISCGLLGFTKIEKVGADEKQEIEAYMKEFINMYTSEACDGKQRIFMKSKDVYAEEQGEPIELTVYTNDQGENIRYKVQVYAETGKSEINYYLCENLIYVNQKKDYYSSWVLTANYDDVLYSQTDDWIILEDKVYTLKDNDEMEIAAEYPFFPIEEVYDWVQE